MYTNRRKFSSAVGLLGSGIWEIAKAQSQLSMNVSLTFPPPIPDLSQLRAHIQQRFSGNIVADAVSPSTTYDALERAAKRVAAGPALDEGKSVYAILVRSDRILFDPLVDGSISPGPEAFRPAYLIGDLPLAIAAGRGLPANSLEELATLAKTRMQSGRSIVIHVARGFPHAIANRLAKAMSVSFMLEVSQGHPHPHRLAEDPATEALISPLSPLLLARAAERKLRILGILASPAVIARAQTIVGANSDLTGKAIGKPFETLALQPTSSVLVSRDEKDNVVRQLHSAWAAAFATPEAPLSGGYIRIDGVDEFGKMAARYELERNRFRELAGKG